ncbi:ACR3 family arsenite efflux transporter [Campylobacter ureolyticus]|nr:ACR3 family arsenite efflux transporter [Campylobacter ureolyticus]MCZ6149676.1 ACR3 family arsenite efflux transporter [Campylobacter ureolyticus]
MEKVNFSAIYIETFKYIYIKRGKRTMVKNKNNGINVFQKYLTLWVLFCMIVGVLIGKYIPIIPSVLGKMQIAGISVPIAILIWIMIYPMMIKVDFQSIKKVRENPKGLFVTWAVNWLIKPFTMFGIAYLFFFIIFKNIIPNDLANDYLAGAVLLGAAPCTAMVFVWSTLTKGDPAYTVVQVATNDLIILLAFVPIVKFLLGVSNVVVPYSTLFISVFLFVTIPLLGGVITRKIVIDKRGKDYFEKQFSSKFDGTTTVGLLLTLIIIFSSQANIILENPFHILLIAIPLTLQTFLIFTIAYALSKKVGLPFKIAAPAGMIGASNFFELSVAVAIAIFGIHSPVALACTVGVLTEVPVILFLVKIANNTKRWFLEN